MTADKAPRRYWCSPHHVELNFYRTSCFDRTSSWVSGDDYDSLKAEHDELKFELEAKQRPLSEQVLSLTLEMDGLKAELEREKKKVEKLRRQRNYWIDEFYQNRTDKIHSESVRNDEELEALDKESEGAG